MNRRNQELCKNTIILAIGQLIPKLIAILILPILTRQLSQIDYGIYELSLSVASFCIPLLSIQIQQGVFRFLIDSNTQNKIIISSSFFFLLFMFTFASVPIIGGWLLYINNIKLAMIFWLAYFSEAFFIWIGQVTRGLGNNLMYSLSSVIYSVLFIGFVALITVINKELNVMYVSISMIIAYGGAFVYIFIEQNVNKYISKDFFKIQSIKQLCNYSGPMVISSVSLWIVSLSDRFFVSAYLGIKMTAIYGVANRIPYLFNSLYNIFNLAWTENTSKLTSEEKKSSYYSDFFARFYQVMVGMMMCMICASPLLFNILIDKKYYSAYGLMSWLYVGIFFSSLVSFFGSIYVGEKRTKEVGISSAIGALINVLINLLFMRRFGIIVAAISTIISYFIICLYRAFDIKRFVNIKYNAKQIYIGLIAILITAYLNNTFNLVGFIIAGLITIVYNLTLNGQFLIYLISRITSIFKIKK